jgi:hypothetical protein
VAGGSHSLVLQVVATSTPVSTLWVLGSIGQDCDTVCAGAGRTCVEGDWGALDETTLSSAVADAGEAWESLCPSGYGGASSFATAPYVNNLQTSCYAKNPSTTSNCNYDNEHWRRLCQCT